MLVDPRKTWRSDLPLFLEDGHPASELVLALANDGQEVVDFPWESAGHLVHVGGGTLLRIWNSRLKRNAYADWMRVKHASDGDERSLAPSPVPPAYAAFVEEFTTRVGSCEPAEFATILAAFAGGGPDDGRDGAGDT